jgi:sugar transferase (PEP-CTERM system associated)
MVLVAASFYLAPVVRFGMVLDPRIVLGLPELIAILMYPLVFYVFDFYSFAERTSRLSFILRFALAILIINFIDTSFFYLFGLRPYSTGILAISAFFAFMVLLLWRFAFIQFTGAPTPLRVVILGAGRTGESLRDYLQSRNDYEVVGFIDDDDKKKGSRLGKTDVLGDTSDLATLVKRLGIDQVIVAIKGRIRPEVFRQLVDVKFDGVEVCEIPTFYERVAEKIPVLHTTNMWLGFADISGVKRNVYNTKLKKIFDKLLSVVGLILALPIMALTFLMIRVESRGPALFRQERVGWDEKTFELIKFRSMRLDAETNGAVWATENDPRVTRVGKVIRLLRLDELPQLWNVLKGEMSFVGPRPERMAFVRGLKEEIPYYTLRHAIKPGITGWAQVSYPYGSSKEDALEKLQYDLYYIKHMSILLDIYIMIRTVHVMLFQKGAR